MRSLISARVVKENFLGKVLFEQTSEWSEAASHVNHSGGTSEDKKFERKSTWQTQPTVRLPGNLLEWSELGEWKMRWKQESYMREPRPQALTLPFSVLDGTIIDQTFTDHLFPPSPSPITSNWEIKKKSLSGEERQGPASWAVTPPAWEAKDRPNPSFPRIIKTLFPDPIRRLILWCQPPSLLKFIASL